MSKRVSSPSTTSPSKRKKRDTGQSSLDAFFASPTRPMMKSASSTHKSLTKASSPEIFDVDLLEYDDEPAQVASSSSREQLTATWKTTTASLSYNKVIRLGESTPSDKEPPYASITQDPVLFATNLPDFLDVDREDSVAFSVVARTLAEIVKTRSRISIINGLTNFFRVVASQHAASLVPAVYLLSNTISPPYVQVELGLGPSAISQSIQQVSGLSTAALRKLYNKCGDPGDVAFEAKINMRTLIPHPPLTIAGVYGSLVRISECKGQGAAKQRQKIVEKLLVAAKGEESRFLVRILSQNLRVGAVRTSILTALARAVVLSSPPQSSILSQHELDWFASMDLQKAIRKGTDNDARERLKAKFKKAEDLLRRMFSLHPDYDHIITSLVEGGFTHMMKCAALTVGVPLHPTLGTPARSLEEVYERFRDLPFSAEFKYDGQRAQIHVYQAEGDTVDVKIFSRHLEDMTSKYPDVTATMRHIFASQALQSAILDAEVVAFDSATGGLKSFQELSGRARKAVNLEDIEIPVCLFIFDLMYLNGQSLLDEDLRARRSLIREHFPPIDPPSKGLAAFAHAKSCDSTEGSVQIEAFWKLAVEGQSEGLMVKLLESGVYASETGSSDAATSPSKKKLSAAYNVDQRTYSWIKLKKDYVTGIGDTLDLIPIGAWHGNGRKAQWWSPILLGLWDPSTQKPVAVCKCMSGFSDAFYKDVTARYNLDDPNNCSVRPTWDCEFGGFRPDVYFRPQEVWELRGADITLSPVSSAAQGLISDKGLSIRFPRFLRLRGDKAVADASTPSFLADMYRKQPSMNGRTGGNDDGDLEDPVSDIAGDESDASV